MDFELPEELRMFKDSLRRFVNSELIPVERQTMAADGEEVKPEFLARFQKHAKDLGIWMMEVPEEYGGPGLSLLQRSIVTEELSRSIALPARGEGITGPSVRHILFTLTGDLKEKYLLPVLRGEKKVSVSGICTCPPSDRAANIRSASASSAAVTLSAKPWKFDVP